MMVYTVDLRPDEHTATIWPLKRLTRCDMVSVSPSTTSFISSGTCSLQLDRANAEFGLVYPLCDCTAIVAQADDDEPVYFKASWALAICAKSCGQGAAAMKVCVQLLNYQIDLEFRDVGDAQAFVGVLRAVGRKTMVVYEAPGVTVFTKDSFRITQLPGYCAQSEYGLSTGVDGVAELSRLWNADELSDFVVKTGNRSFNVHRVVLSLRSQYFRNACKPGFQESVTASIALEEDATTTEALLMEVYGVPNPITGSVFTTFALEPEMKKEATMSTLLTLYVAAEKYDLQAIQQRAASAFLDRLPFLHDAYDLLDLANFALDSVPERDCGLRASLVRLVQARLPAILQDPVATEELAKNALVYMAVLRGFAEMVREGVVIVDMGAEGRGRKRKMLE